MSLKSIPKYAAALVMMCSVAACHTAPKTIEGVVVDERSGQPIAGVIVTGKWDQTGGLAHSTTLCVHAESAVTNERGEFQLKNWDYVRSFQEYFTSSKPKPSFWAYKTGLFKSPNIPVYQTKPSQRLILKLKPFVGTTDEHMRYLKQSTVLCHDPEGVLLRLYDAVLEEAVAIAETPEQKKWAEWSALVAKESHEDFSRRNQEANK